MSTDKKIDPFWLNDLTILFENDRFLEFWISQDMHDIEKLNSIMRFAIYLSLILVIYNSDFKYLLLALFVALVTLFIYKFGLKKFQCPEFFEDVTDEKITTHDKQKFKTPTLNNPFMNSSVYDIQDPYNKRAIPYPDNSEKSLAVKKEIDDKFSYNLYEDYADVYKTGGSRQRFYTMPAEFTAHDRQRESLKFFFGDMDPKKSKSFKTLNGVYVNYGRAG